MKPKVFIVDDHEAILRALEFALPTLLPCVIVGAVRNAAEALKAIPQLKPDVLWVDVCLPEIDGPNLLRLLRVREIFPGRVLFTGAAGGALIREAISVEPEGFVSKADNMECWRKALEAASQGGSYCSPRIAEAKKSGPDTALARLSDMERIVFSLVVQDKTKEDIAERLSVSSHTVRHYRERMMGKLGAHSAVDLCKIAMRAGLLE